MGKGSRNFALYYGCFSLLYLVITAVAFALIVSVVPDCEVKCPTLIQGTSSLDYHACICNTSLGMTSAVGYVNSSATGTLAQQAERYDLIYEATVAAGKYCYICPSIGDPTVYEACGTFDECKRGNMLGFRPAQINSSMVCDTQTAGQAAASILVSPTVTARAYVLGVLYAVAVGYLIQFLGALVCFAAFFMFKDKYGPDWGRLSKTEQRFGIMAKVFPILTRIINFIVIFFLIVASVSVFQNNVCRYDTNAFNQIMFYPTITAFTVFVGLSWIFTCVFGVFFQLLVPVDTSFYAPEFPTDKNANFCKRCCCSFCWVVTTFGP